MQKKLLMICAGITLLSLSIHAATPLQKALPLLQKNNRTQAENQQVLQLFRTSTDPDTVFAAGASLVRIPPTKAQEPVLFNILMRSADGLKQTFAAVIITAMGSIHSELTPTLLQALSGQDIVLRSYAAGAYALITPTDKTYTNDVVRLYAFDPAFAQRALNALTKNASQLFKYVKQAASADDASTRAAAAAWLGNQHSSEAAKLLLKRAKKETDSAVSTQIATALAKNRELTLSDTVAGLKQNYKTPQSATYALALGFMTGNATEYLRRGLMDKNSNIRINSARAAAYMAGVLANPDAFAYSQDRTFDIHLLKGLIAPLKALAISGSTDEQLYAQNALKQIEKLME